MSSVNILSNPNTSEFHVDGLYGVYRWDEHLNTRPGTYRVVAGNVALQLAWMGDGMTYRNPTCVVDDFGSLVKVPA